MHRRAGRAAGALSVVALAAFGQQTGPALAVGTVAETQPSASVSGTPFSQYAGEEIVAPTAVDVTESLLVNGFMPLVDLSAAAVAWCVLRPSAGGAVPHCAGGPTAVS